MTNPFLASASRRILRSAFTAIAVLPFAGCGTLVQIVDQDGAPVRGARVAAEWTFYGEWSTTDEDGYARVDDGHVGLAWPLLPAALVVRTAGHEFHVAYPPPSPVRLPIAIETAAAPVESSR